MKTLQERLKWARNRAKKTQSAVAEFVGIAQPTYSELETGESQGSAYIPEIAHFLGVNAYWLATGRGEPDPPPDDVSRDYASLSEQDQLTVRRLMEALSSNPSRSNHR